MKYFIKNKHWKINKDYDIDKILYLLIDRPTYINYNSFIWQNKKSQIHRDYDLPAHTNSSGYVYWYKNNNLHRESNKPAVILANSIKEYYTNGKFIKKENENEIFNKK